MKQVIRCLQFGLPCLTDQNKNTRDYFFASRKHSSFVLFFDWNSRKKNKFFFLFRFVLGQFRAGERCGVSQCRCGIWYNHCLQCDQMDSFEFRWSGSSTVFQTNFSRITTRWTIITRATTMVQLSSETSNDGKRTLLHWSSLNRIRCILEGHYRNL